MGSNASTGLGGKAYHGSRDVRSMETEEQCSRKRVQHLNVKSHVLLDFQKNVKT